MKPKQEVVGNEIREPIQGPGDEPSPEQRLLDEQSAEFVGRWQRLVSTTNWEKGRIIHQWRTALIQSAAPQSQYADEAWARRVGSVSGQHVGRLRRVWERFGQAAVPDARLFWSHYQAALEWTDAELWLEGAALESWSVAEMRRRRWEALGAPAELRPRDEDILLAEFDEDAPPLDDPRERSTAGEILEVRDGDTAGDEEPLSAADAFERHSDEFPDEASSVGEGPSAATSTAVRPFANLAQLPADLQEAFEMLKLAIVRHRAAGWGEVARDDLLAAVDALRVLILAEPLES